MAHSPALPVWVTSYHDQEADGEITQARGEHSVKISQSQEPGRHWGPLSCVFITSCSVILHGLQPFFSVPSAQAFPP